jgi:hypothetical protein
VTAFDNEMPTSSKRERGHLIPLYLIIILVLALLTPTLSGPASAQGIAISGTFYRHRFQLIPGETISTPDIFVVVFNHDVEPIRVKLTTQSPPSVELLIAETEFSIPPGGDHIVEVGVRASPDAVPGEYTVAITADVVREGTGIVVTTGAQQQAKLSIFGEAGTARITTVTYDGEPFTAELHVFQKVEERLSPVAYSPTGELETRLVPGDYMIQALYQGTEVAIEDFTIRADETLDIVVTARTVSVAGFSAVPNLFVDTEDIAFVKLVYSIKNIYQPEPNVRATLNVSLDKELLEEGEIFSLPTLDVGKTEGSYQYIPAQRWQKGNYAFKLELRSRETGVLIAESRLVGFRLVPTETGLGVGLHDEFDLNPSGGTLVSSDGKVTITAAAGAVDEATTVVIETPLETPSPPGGFSPGSTVVTIEATSGSGVPVEGLLVPVKICLLYTADELGKAGGDPSHLYAGYYDAELATWHVLDSETIPEDFQVCATTEHWSLWATFIEHKRLPVWVTVIAIVGGMALGIALVALAQRYRLLQRANRVARRSRAVRRLEDRLSRLPLGRLARPLVKARRFCSRSLRWVSGKLRLARVRSAFGAVWARLSLWLRRLLRRPPSEG